MPKPPLRLPREHGFWVMLSAVILSAVLRAGASIEAALAAVLVFAASVVGAMILSRRIRSSGSAQLGSAVAISVLGVPVALVAGVSWAEAWLVAGAWAAIFLSSAAVVRAAFSRARGDVARARTLLVGAVLLPAAVAATYFFSWQPGAAAACLVAALGAAVIGVWGPGVKQLKPVGLSLALVALLATAALSA